LNIGGDGSLAKIAQVADIASGVVSVVNSTTAPVLCQMVDGAGGSVAITNGLVGTYLADTTTNTPVKVNVRVVSGAPVGELATTVLPPEAKVGAAVAVVGNDWNGLFPSETARKDEVIVPVVVTAAQFYRAMLEFSADKKRSGDCSLVVETDHCYDRYVAEVEDSDGRSLMFSASRRRVC